ncbi:MAG: S-adenosyl-l-methionine hydroxide adenosyltransferase family protein [Candidatus Aminicenantales bacterium]
MHKIKRVDHARPPVIALLTDFGESDFFTGSLRGVIAGIQPSARVFDITHGVASFDILAGAFILRAAFPYYPEGTVFLSVVDPGVGTSRRILVVETQRFFFVAPDNGLLSLALELESPKTIVAASNPRYFLESPGQTFEARDKMAPVAAWLSRGVPIEEFGDAIPDYNRLDIPPPRVHKRGITGRVLYADKFGNLITNIPWKDVDRLAKSVSGRRLACRTGGRMVRRMVAAYAEADRGEAVFLPGSLGLVEVAVREGSAARDLGARPGDSVAVMVSEEDAGKE